jgi:hypothetical protein
MSYYLCAVVSSADFGSGIGIGIGVRQSFSQNGKASLLSVGILNSISAGILVSPLGGELSY